MDQLAMGDGRRLVLRRLREDELPDAHKLLVEIFGDERDIRQDLLEGMLTNYSKHSYLFYGCFDGNRIVGTVVGWPDPTVLGVRAIAVLEPYRRKGIGTALLKVFDRAARREGFDNFVLGARWEAIPFYLSYGLQCFGNVQIEPDRIPWDRLQELVTGYRILAGVVFSQSDQSDLVLRLVKSLRVRVGQVKKDFESVSIQIRPSEISEKALEQIKKDFNATSAQFCFKKRI